MARIWGVLSRLPRFLKICIEKSIRSISIDGWNGVVRPVHSVLPPDSRNFGDKAYKLAGLLSSPDFVRFYERFVSHWSESQDIVLGVQEPINCFSGFEDGAVFANPFELMMLADSVAYLPDDILVKVDRAAMGVSLETRVPFLDHRIFEFAWQLPLDLKFRDGRGKWILRQLLYRHVPKELVERPKMGFGVPIDTWLRGPLRDWAETLLCEKRLLGDGYFNPGPIRKKWLEHVSGKRNWQYHLWDVLMFQAWLDNERSSHVARGLN